MRKIKDLKSKLTLTLIYAVILLLFWIHKLPCVFLRFLGIRCPGCGMSHAIWAALRLDFAAAFCYHPMFWAMPILYLYFLYDGKLFGKKCIDYGFLIFCGVGFLVNWIIRLC